jgi:5-methylcytosine-specific restriction enzyme A
MVKITEQAIHVAYTIAREIHEGRLTNKQGLDALQKIHGMNRNSASDYIHTYRCMVEGRRFTRTINVYATEYYLTKFHELGGRARLLNALSSLRQHFDYYEGIDKTKVQAARSIYNRFVEMAQIETVEVFADEVSDSKFLTEGKASRVLVNVFERNPIAREQCIAYYGCSCIICGFDFEKTYGVLGKSFIHVHHLIELSSIGSEYSVNPIFDLMSQLPCDDSSEKRPCIFNRRSEE